MAAISAITFENLFGERKLVQLLHPDRAKHKYEATIITGQNGSHKSTLLKQIVSVFVPQADESKNDELVDAKGDLTDCSLLCISGSPADRFPQRQFPNGARTAYDIPSYAYVGQRVMNNILSRKAPLETVLCFALAPQKSNRYDWEFYRDAHAHAGIQPTVSFTFNTRNKLVKSNLEIRETLKKLSPGDDKLKFQNRVHPHVSYATAQWLLCSFTEQEFSELEELLVSRPNGQFRAHLSKDGVATTRGSSNVLRLGLLLDLVQLADVKVQSVRTGNEFSLFDLSSGEYHMYLTMLAVGFGVEEDTVLLIDEPENHLHPQWQRDLMASIFGVFSKVKSKGQIIVSTHSPLIVGSAPEGTSVVDLTYDEPLTRLVSYGASSDELLLNNFGIGSSRNRVVVDTIQRAIGFVERGDLSSPNFLALAPSLKLIRKALNPSDPMIEVVDALLAESKSQ